MNRTRAVLSASLLLSALALGGCSDDDPEPRFGPSETSSPSFSGPTTASADPVATVKEWVDAQNRAMTSGDSSAVRSLASDDCDSCDGLIDPIDKVIAAGGRFETTGWAVDKAERVTGDEHRATVTAAVTIAGGRTYNSADAQPVEYDVDHSILEFRLKQVDGTWLVAFVGFVS